MLRRLVRSPVAAIALVALVAIASPRAATLLFVMWTIALAVRHDGDTGTWSTLYCVFLLILAILAMLLAGLALLHRWISG